MNGARWIVAVAGCAVIAGAAIAAVEDDLGDLFRRVRYAEAQDRLAAVRQESLGTQWWRARLTQDADEFERLALEVTRDPGATDNFKLRVGIARAREHFARGRYQTAVTVLESFLVDERPVDPELSIWLGMAHQAAGSVRPAENAFAAVPSGSRQYGTAQVLLAELSLRSGRPRQASECARRAMDADPSVSAPALAVLHRVAVSGGEADRADEIARRLAQVAPRSVEAMGLSPRVATAIPRQSDDRSVPEADAPASRSNFSLQLGAFRDRALALRLVSSVEGRVESVRIEVDRSEEPALYRVVAGTFGTRSQAEARRDELRSIGIETFLLSPGRPVR